MIRNLWDREREFLSSLQFLLRRYAQLLVELRQLVRMKDHFLFSVVASFLPLIVFISTLSLENNFEGGTLFPWIEQSKSVVKWKIENRTSAWEPGNAAPLPSNGTNYLRVNRGSSLAFGVAVLRSQVFTVAPFSRDTTFSFSFWIRSKWPQFTNLELYLAKNGNEGLLLNLYEYSNISNNVWQSETLKITDDSSSNLTLVFYAYCGTDTEDAVAIDGLLFITPQQTTSTTSNTSPSYETESTESTESMSSTTTQQPTTNTTTTPSTTRSITVTLPTNPSTNSTVDITTNPTPPTTEGITMSPTDGPTDYITTEPSTVTETIPTDAPTIATTALAEEKCPDLLQEDPNVPCWTLGTKCYCFYNGSAQYNWTDADLFCKEGNMFTLVTIETQEEDSLIHNHVISTSELPNELYWTAGRYSLAGQWEWASNAPFQPFNYTNWVTGEPNGEQVEFCTYASFSSSDFTLGYWIDDLCMVSGFKFICEQND